MKDQVFRLALRNIFRNKRRTLLTFGTIIAGMIGLIIFGGFVEYSYWGLRESTIRSQLGHIQIYKKGYFDKGAASAADYLIDDPQQVEEYLETIPYVKLSTQRLSFSGLISTGENTLICQGNGVIPAKEAELASFETIVEGENLFEAGKEEIVIGSEIQKGLNAQMGSYLTVLTTSPSGMINAADMELIGVSRSGSKEYDSVFIKMPLQVVQSLLGTDKVESIVLLLDKTEYTDEVVGRLKRLFQEKHLDLELKTWNELATYYNSVVRLFNGIFDVIKIIIAAVVLFSIANTMMMSVFERIREIGTLRAIGTKKRGIIKMFLWEGFLVGAIGAFMGMIIAGVVALMINISGGINMPPPPGMSVGYNALIAIVPQVLIYSYSSTVIVATVSALYPASRAIKLSIVESLGHN